MSAPTSQQGNSGASPIKVDVVVTGGTGGAGSGGGGYTPPAADPTPSVEPFARPPVQCACKCGAETGGGSGA